jgi:hypothetical protein
MIRRAKPSGGGGPAREIIDARLEGEGFSDGARSPDDVARGQFDRRLGLQGRHEKTAGPGAARTFHVQNAEMLASPRGRQPVRPAAEFVDMGLAVAKGST